MVSPQTSASLFADDYDAKCHAADEQGVSVPAITSAQRSARQCRWPWCAAIALVSPYSQPVPSARTYYQTSDGLEVLALEGFAADLGKWSRAMRSLDDRPEIDIFVVPGGNFGRWRSVPECGERELASR